jgi:hypothetical protein
VAADGPAALITISVLFFRGVNAQDRAERAAAAEFDELFMPAEVLEDGEPPRDMADMATEAQPVK